MKTYKLLLLLVASMVLTFDANAMKRAADGDADRSDGKQAKRAKVDASADKDSKKAAHADEKQLLLVQEKLESAIKTYTRLGVISKIQIELIPKKALDPYTKIFVEIDVIEKIKSSEGSEDSELAINLDFEIHKTITKLIVDGLAHFLDVCSSPLDAFKSFTYRIESQRGTGDTYTNMVDLK